MSCASRAKRFFWRDENCLKTSSAVVFCGENAGGRLAGPAIADREQADPGHSSFWRTAQYPLVQNCCRPRRCVVGSWTRGRAGGSAVSCSPSCGGWGFTPLAESHAGLWSPSKQVGILSCSNMAGRCTSRGSRVVASRSPLPRGGRSSRKPGSCMNSSLSSISLQFPKRSLHLSGS